MEFLLSALLVAMLFYAALSMAAGVVFTVIVVVWLIRLAVDARSGRE